MDPVNNEENKKQNVGSFVASDQASDGTSSSGVIEETLDERLAAMTRSIEIEKEESTGKEDVQTTMSTEPGDQSQPPQESSQAVQNDSDGNLAQTPIAPQPHIVE
jgi:sulfate adenylyltransferase subunit 1 (EFTu-like GTPase family)